MRTVMLCVCMLMLAACTREPKDLKSPCVGVDESPCGPKRPVNASNSIVLRA